MKRSLKILTVVAVALLLAVPIVSAVPSDGDNKIKSSSTGAYYKTTEFITLKQFNNISSDNSTVLLSYLDQYFSKSLGGDTISRFDDFMNESDATCSISGNKELDRSVNKYSGSLIDTMECSTSAASTVVFDSTMLTGLFMQKANTYLDEIRMYESMFYTVMYDIMVIEEKETEYTETAVGAVPVSVKDTITEEMDCKYTVTANTNSVTMSVKYKCVTVNTTTYTYSTDVKRADAPTLSAIAANVVSINFDNFTMNGVVNQAEYSMEIDDYAKSKIEADMSKSVSTTVTNNIVSHTVSLKSLVKNYSDDLSAESYLKSIRCEYGTDYNTVNNRIDDCLGIKHEVKSADYTLLIAIIIADLIVLILIGVIYVKKG